MTAISSSDPTTHLRMFINLYKQLNSNKYPETSKVLNNDNQRLQFYLKKIILNEIDDEKIFFEIVQLNKLLPLINSPKVKIGDLNLSKWIGGRAYRFDEKIDDQARNLFFEADFALRFIKSKINFETIDLNYGEIKDQCDIVIDEKIIIECKSISSKRSIYKRIREANEQLITRLQSSTRDMAGAIAIDITQIIQPNIQTFIERQLSPILYKNNLINRLEHNTSDPEVARTIYENCNHFFNEQLKKLNITEDRLKTLQVSQDIYSIMIQSEIPIIIDKKNKRENSLEIIPIFGRAMVPFQNPLYTGKVEFPLGFHKSLEHNF